MADVFEVLGQDHQEVKRMLAELEKGPTAAAGASGNPWPCARRWSSSWSSRSPSTRRWKRCTSGPRYGDKLSDGDQLADTATGQEQEGKEVLAKLDKLEADQPEFEQLVSTFIAAGREHIGYEEGQVWPQLRSQLTPDEARSIGEKIAEGKKTAPTRPHPHTPASPGC